jgi:hypothetical protein
MQDALLGVTMLGIGWLVVWCCTDHSKPSNRWWPFDFRTSDPVTPPTEPEPRGTLWRTRQNPTRRWKRSGF